ncbi:hypothetical protein [Bizionia argentinensis]|nr:hypothetical protein [Bizionia argentinensis]
MGFSQHGTVKIVNGIGIYAGITQYDLVSNNFTTKKGAGWMLGASATVDLPHKWYNMSYNIQLAENNLGIAASNIGYSNEEFIDYKVLTAQIALLVHIKLIESFLTIDVGPMLQYNGQLDLDDKNQGGFMIANYNNLLAKDIKEISRFNVDGAIGLSAGFNHFRLKAQYIYGILNTLDNLNKQNLDQTGNTGKFKGNQSMLAFTAMVSF